MSPPRCFGRRVSAPLRPSPRPLPRGEGGAKDPVEVNICSSASGAPPASRVRRVVRTIARETGASAAEISILFCGDGRIRALNRRFRGKDRATDVLAFPQADAERLLGDIAISVPYASRQARRAAEPLARELDRLLLHGFLHLLGYDHETDRGEMDALEGELRRRLNLSPAVAGRRRERGTPS